MERQGFLSVSDTQLGSSFGRGWWWGCVVNVEEELERTTSPTSLRLICFSQQRSPAVDPTSPEIPLPLFSERPFLPSFHYSLCSTVSTVCVCPLLV